MSELSLDSPLGQDYHQFMTEEPDDRPPYYASGFEPPTDVNVPWYAWVLWPLIVLATVVLAAVFLRGCLGMF